MSQRSHCFWLQFRAIYLQGEILSDDVPAVALTDSVKVAELDDPELRSSRVCAKELLGHSRGRGLKGVVCA